MPEIQFDVNGLVTGVVQDASSGAVLMVAYLNAESLALTKQTGEVWFWSRSRGRLWKKGETSGNVLRLRSITVDCDGDVLLIAADPAGPACHTGATTCFQELIAGEAPLASTAVLGEVWQVLEQRRRDLPEGSYSAHLFRGGVDRIGKKVIEEAGEAVIAGKNREQGELVKELADLWFHSMMLALDGGVRLEDVYAELGKRQGGTPRDGSTG